MTAAIPARLTASPCIRLLLTLPLFLALLLLSVPARGASHIQGFMRAPGVTGQPGAGLVRWDREIVWAIPHDSSGVGGGMRMLGEEPGWFFIDPPGGIPGGTYTLLTMNLGNVDGGSTGVDIGPTIQVPAGGVPFEGQDWVTAGHYSVMYDGKDYTQWASDPWLWGTDFYQTFVATDTDVIRIATRLADKSPAYTALNLNYAVYETNAGPPSSWTQISPVRVRHLSPTTDPIIHTFDVNFLSTEMTLVPGEEYAVRFWRDASSTSTSFAIVARPDSGNGYAGGRAYVGDSPQNYDIFGYITGGEPGIVENFGPTNQGQPQDVTFNASGNRHGQVFRATGSGLAAVELMYAKGCAPNPRFFMTIRVYDQPGGTQIGPSRRVYTVTDLCQGRAVAYWPQGDIPLNPGQSYYVEFDSTEGGGTDVWRLNGDIPNAYAVLNGVPQTSADLALTIAEYTSGDIPTPGPTSTPTVTPVPTSTPTPITAPNLLQNGDMQDGQTGTGGHAPDHWTKWTGSGSPQWWYGDYGRNGTLGARLIGGAINGTTFDAGLYQQITGLTPGVTYGLTGWISITPTLSPDYESFIGVDPTGQTSNGTAGTIQYTRFGGTAVYEQMPVHTFTATGSTASVWLRAHNTSTQALFHVDFDDLHLFVYTPGPTPTPTPPATPTPTPTPPAGDNATLQTW